MVPLKPLVLCSLLLTWGYKEIQCKSPDKELDEESDDNDDRGSDEKQYTIRKVADNIDGRVLNEIASAIWRSGQDLPVEYDGVRDKEGNLRLFKEDGKTLEAIRNTFKDLFGFYNKNRGVDDPCVQQKKKCKKAQDDFLNRISKEKPIKKLDEQLPGHLRRLKITVLKKYLEEIWFTAYSSKKHSGKLDSSGFEHVFLGEIDEMGNVTGLHNWMRMYEEEVGGNFKLSKAAKYYPLPINESFIADVDFTWYGHKRTQWSTFFMKKSPAVEIALYTLCHMVRRGQKCSMNLGKDIVNVKVIPVGSRTDMILTAFLEFPKSTLTY